MRLVFSMWVFFVCEEAIGLPWGKQEASMSIADEAIVCFPFVLW